MGVMVAQEDDIISIVQRVMIAAEKAHEAAVGDPKTPPCVSAATKRTLEATRPLLAFAHDSPKVRRRQSFTEFTTMLGEEMKEAAEEQLVVAERTLRKAKSLIEDHFLIDEAFRMLGPLTQDANRARDVHDLFNLTALLPVIFFDVLNWGCPNEYGMFCFDIFQREGLVNGFTRLWHGEAFIAFWWTTFIYFVLDLCWMVLLPDCVRSPGVIIKHHLVTLGYICVPKVHPQYGWLMGACMIVEVNTWFLIARRYFNKIGDKPFCTGVTLAKSLRLIAVSTWFYLTWFVIRLVIYPVLFIVISYEYYRHSTDTGTYFNLIAITPVMQITFIFLNVKWTIDLFRSKLKSTGAAKGL